MKKYLYALLICTLSAGCNALVNKQESDASNNPYGLEIISEKAAYDSLVSVEPEKALVDLEKEIPGIMLDIRYATDNNFTAEVIYSTPAAFTRKEVAEALKKVQQELNAQGLGLKIFDAYRPYSATLKFYEVYPDTMFVAAPWYGSRHNRGCAVDVSLVELESGQELEMPTPFDDFSEKAHTDYADLPEKIIQNRQLLIDIMTKNGFSIYPYEWWHYDFEGWENYRLMDISFEEL